MWETLQSKGRENQPAGYRYKHWFSFFVDKRHYRFLRNELKIARIQMFQIIALTNIVNLFIIVSVKQVQSSTFSSNFCRTYDDPRRNFEFHKKYISQLLWYRCGKNAICSIRAQPKYRKLHDNVVWADTWHTFPFFESANTKSEYKWRQISFSWNVIVKIRIWV